MVGNIRHMMWENLREDRYYISPPYGNICPGYIAYKVGKEDKYGIRVLTYLPSNRSISVDRVSFFKGDWELRTLEVYMLLGISP